MKTKASLLSHSYHHIGGHPLKTFSLLVWDSSAKRSLCQMIITISNSSAPWSQPPSIPDAALSCVYFFIFLLKRLLCSVYCYFVGACCTTGTDWLRCSLSLRVACCHGYRTMTQSRGCRGNLTGTSCFCVKETLTSVARSVQTTPVLFCVHSAAFASYLCVCVCLCTCFPSMWGL